MLRNMTPYIADDTFPLVQPEVYSLWVESRVVPTVVCAEGFPQLSGLTMRLV